MAQKVVVQLVDDIDGSPLKSARSTVAFALEGASYEIDLSDENRARLRSALAPYIKAGRKVGGAAPRRGASSGRKAARKGGGEAAAIREWARANGHQVSERGRVSAELAAAYRAAQ